MKTFFSNFIIRLIRKDKVEKELAIFRDEIDQYLQEDRGPRDRSNEDEELEKIIIPEDTNAGFREIPKASLLKTEVIKIAFLTEMGEIKRKQIEEMMLGMSLSKKMRPVLQMVYLENYKKRVYEYTEPYQFIQFRKNRIQERIELIKQLERKELKTNQELDIEIARQKNLLSKLKIEGTLKLIGNERIDVDGELMMIRNRDQDLEKSNRRGIIADWKYRESKLILGLYLVDKIDELYERRK